MVVDSVVFYHEYVLVLEQAVIYIYCSYWTVISRALYLYNPPTDFN